MIRRRQLLAGLGASLALPACERIGSAAPAQEILYGTERFTRAAMRLVTDRRALARE
ncbi:MAG TPA: hypothetical protein VFJ13_07615 [Paracoccaceae bacterium]|nr:hypothetical protein [Paracoccaceae bacterium]